MLQIKKWETKTYSYKWIYSIYGFKNFNENTIQICDWEKSHGQWFYKVTWINPGRWQIWFVFAKTLETDSSIKAFEIKVDYDVVDSPDVTREVECGESKERSQVKKNAAYLYNNRKEFPSWCNEINPSILVWVLWDMANKDTLSAMKDQLGDELESNPLKSIWSFTPIVWDGIDAYDYISTIHNETDAWKCAWWIILATSLAPTMKSSYFKPFKKELVDVLIYRKF